MKVTRQQAEENRKKIIESAGRLFRERGFDGVSLIDLMGAAGLTHGGFYANFKSKDELAVLACDQVLENACKEWQAIAENDGEALSRILEHYLTTCQSSDIGYSCAYASLGGDVARHGDDRLKASFTNGLARLIEILARTFPLESQEAREEKALMSFSTMVGGLVLSRCTDDPALSARILKAVQKGLSKNV